MTNFSRDAGGRGRRRLWAACLFAACAAGCRERPRKKALPHGPPVEPSRAESVPTGAVDEFAGIAFPKAAPKPAAGREAEVPFEKGRARAARVRGLVLAKKEESGWRLLRRGSALAPGETARASRRLGSGAILRGPDGSRVFFGSGARVTFEDPRRWRIVEGEAQFRVASGKGLPGFVVECPGGRLVAGGTEFSLTVGADGTSCRVVKGAVELSPRRGAGVKLRAGESGLLKPGGVDRFEKDVTFDWLRALEEPADDHGVGELLARAEDDKEGELHPLEIKSHRVTVTVVHPVARTFIDEVFVNNTDGRMEGVFYYTLPPDAAVSEFAMYVNDKRILGEVLEQHRARQVFEYIRRERRDPALLEWVGGNLFKMRVFPLEPKSEKRIQLAYTQVLRRDRGRVSYTYPLYSEKLLKNPLRELDVTFRVASPRGLARLECKSHRAEAVLTDDGRGAVSFSARDYSPERDFAVSYEVDDEAECLAFANARPDEEEGYFLLELAPKVELPPREPATRMLVVVDGSASVGAQGYALATEFAAAAADFTQGWDYNVILTGEEPERWREGFVEAGSESSEKVRQFLSQHVLLGGTDLLASFRAASEMILPGERAEIVYVGDGIDTLGELEGPALVREIAGHFHDKPVRLSCVAVGPAYDEPFLRGLASTFGGSFVRVDEAQDVFVAADEIMERVSRPVLRELELAFEGVRVSRVYPERLTGLFAGSSAVVVGRLKKGGEGKVILRGRAEDEDFERTYRVNLRPDEKRNRFVPRLWARARIEDLLSGLGMMSREEDGRIRNNVIETSVRYQIMSPYTAFLVLESEEDYARFGIRRRLKMWDWEGDEAGLEISAGGKGKEEAARTAAPAVLMRAGAEEPPSLVIDRLGTVDKDLNGRYAEILDGLSFEYGPGEERRERESLRSSLDWGKNALSDIRFGGGESFRNMRKARSGRLSRSGGIGGGAGRYAPHYWPPAIQGTEIAGLKIDRPRRPSWVYRRLASAGKASPDTQLNLALAFEAEGRFNKALEALAPVIEAHPEVPELYLERGALRARAGDEDGMREAFEKALDLTEKKKRRQMEIRVAQLFGSLSRHSDAADAYERLASSPEYVSQASQFYQYAASYYVHAQERDRAREVWEKALKRLPNEAPVWLAAGQWFANQNEPKRAAEMLRKARDLGAKATPVLIQALSRAGDKEEALKLVREIIKSAKQQGEIWSALYNLGNYDRPAATAEAVRLIESRPRAEILAGAVQYLQSYAQRNPRAVEAVLKAVEREDFSAAARQQAFHFLWNSGRRGEEALRVVRPLLEDTSSPEAIGRAVSAVSTIAHRLPKEALGHIERLLALEGIEKWRASLVGSRWQVLQRLGRHEEAERAMESAFSEAKEENTAYQAAWQLFHARLNRADTKGALDVIIEFEKRFPESQQLPQMYRYLLQNLRGRGKKEEMGEIVKRLAKAHPENPSYAAARARMLAREGKFRDAARLLRETLERLEEKRRSLENIKPEELPAAPTIEELPEEERAKATAERRAREQALAQWRVKVDSAEDARASVILWLGRVSSQDEELKAGFLKQAGEKLKTEDTVLREWTEGAVACLEASGDEAAHLARLERLVKDEPRDPVWPYRLGYAYIRAEKLKEGRATLARLLEEDPDDSSLALTLYGVCLRLKDKGAAGRFRLRAFEALKKRPNELQQLAYRWRESRPEWALEAWKALNELEQWRQNGSAAYQAAQIAAKLERKSEAAELYLEAILAPAGHYGDSAGRNLAALCKEEEVLRAVQPRVKKALAGASGRQAVYLRLLAYRLEKLRGREEDANRELSAAARLELPSHDQSAGQAVLNALVEEKRFDDAEKYALSAGEKLPRDARRNLLRNAASRFNNKDNWHRAVRLYRGLLEEPDQQSQNERRSLVDILVRWGSLDEAGAELRRMEAGTNPSALQHAWQRVARGHRDRGDYEKAVRLALEGWKKLRDDRQGYGRNMLSSLVDISYNAFRRRKELPPELAEEVAEALLDGARAYFGGETSVRTLWSYGDGSVPRRLGIEEKIKELDRAAAESEDATRVMRAAQYSQGRGLYEKARNRYERALELGGERRQILLQLYGLCVNHHVKDWGSALEYLGALKGIGAYDENSYLRERVRCLYGLGRRDEARQVCRKLIKAREYARNHSRLSSVARYAERAEDFEMAAELWEAAVRFLRATGRTQSHYVASYYEALARTYERDGRHEKAVESFLRGLSLLSRNDSYYRRLLRSMGGFVFKGRGIDEAVRQYEEEIKATGGAERPHLRIAFGEAYKKARRTKEALGQFRRASDLLPKDVELRREVIQGYKKLGEDEAAIDAYYAWTKFDPQNIEIYRGLGDWYEKLGRAKEARAAWATMAEVRPREAEGHREYARVLTRLKDHERAASALRKAVRFRPTEYEIAKELAQCYGRLNERGRTPGLWKAGEAACRRGVRDLPDDPQPWLNLGLFLKEQGRTDEERELYEEIIRRPWPRFRWETVREAKKRLGR